MQIARPEGILFVLQPLSQAGKLDPETAPDSTMSAQFYANLLF